MSSRTCAKRDVDSKVISCCCAASAAKEVIRPSC
jgi:hypothetical protein